MAGLPGERFGKAAGTLDDVFAKPAWHDGRAQDAAGMVVHAGIERGGHSVFRARDHNGDLPFERHEGFQHGGHVADGAIGCGEVVTRLQPDLSLAVIAVTARLEQAFTAEQGERLFQIIGGVHRFEMAGLDPDGIEETLLAQPVLRDLQGLCARPDDGALFQEELDGGDRDVLEFIGDGIAGPGEGCQRVLILIGGLPVFGGDARSRRIILRG